jgi:LacI family transcriptional regulator, galactose operon repressor
MGSKLTIEDIARLAGVSKATVSRVLNQKSNVDPATRERVLRVINEKRFVPSITASGLAGGRSRLIGLLTPPLTWPTISEIMHGVAEAIERSSYEIVLYSIGRARDHSDILDRILDMRLTSGLIAILPGQLGEHLVDLYEQGLPIVEIDDQEPLTPMPWVGIDNYESAYQATLHLIRLGHRRIAHIQGPSDFRCSRERQQGYCQALLDQGLVPDPELVLQGSFEITSGRICANAIFSMSTDERPSAIFVGNDQMAFGVLAVAEQHGIRVPEDVAVVGFDDIPLSAHMRPALTTMRQPFHEIGKTAVELLLSLVDPQFSVAEAEHVQPFPSTGVMEPVRFYLPTHLVVRESCGSSQRISMSEGS